MSKTPDVLTGNPIASTWGNEIRDRSVQVFASLAELNGWAAPNGSIAYRGDARRYYARISGAWLAFSVNYGSSFVGTTSATGSLIIAHGLGVAPRSAVVTPTADNANFQIAQVAAISATNIDVVCRDNAGVRMNSTNLSLYYMVSV